jgi:multiple sugar transport system ATP-binding protein
VFLFDEPLSNLDAALRVEMRIELGRLHRELGTTMIYVTHDQVEAMTLGERIAVFNQGRIEQLGTPLSLYEQPANEFVAGFLGSPRINLVPRPDASAPPASRAYWDALWAARPGGMPAGVQRAGIRPEHLALCDAGTGVPAEVVLAEHLGDASVLHLRVEGVDALQTAKVGPDRHRARAGDRVGLRPDGGWVVGFDTSGTRIG